jgi:predicted lipoprotein with Yx(FWY)xxD motif
MRTSVWIAVVAVGALALTASGWSEAGDRAPVAPSVAAGSEPSASKPVGAKRSKLRLIKTRFGRILADGDRYALYLFTRDAGQGSACDGACARAWPPLKTRHQPRAGKDLDDDLVGTTRRRSGNKQITYAGHPLYYYVGDRDPKDVLCQDVEEFGGHWYVVARDGAPIR